MSLGIFAASAPATAYDFTAPQLIDSSTNQVCPGNGLVRRIVPCIKENIIMAVRNFLIPFSNYLANTVTICCALAVTLWGARMISGNEVAPLRDGMVVALKIAFVMAFTVNFGGNTLDPGGEHNGTFGTVLDMMDQMVALVSGYVVNGSHFGLSSDCPNFKDVKETYLIWNSVDCAVQTLIGGIFSPVTLSAGIVGFLVSCLFSNTIGFAIGMIGIYLIYQMVYAVIKCVYMYLSAYVGIAFMVIISPLFIPLILFQGTKGYFDKWLKLFLSFFIQPMVLFAYMAMLLAAFDVVVYTGQNSLYRAIAGPAVDDPNFITDGGFGWWCLLNACYTNKDLAGQAITLDVKAIKDAGLIPQEARDTGATGTVMFQYLEGYGKTKMETLGISGDKPRFFEIDLPVQTVNWPQLASLRGYSNTTSYLLNVLISVFMAMATGYIFIEMLEIIPFIGANFSSDHKAGKGMSLPSLGGGKKMSFFGGSDFGGAAKGGDGVVK